MFQHPMKYNPSFLSEEELIESFVVRHDDLDTILRIVSENVTDSNQHVLVIGPRGSGKTTLVQRVAAGIKQNEALNKHWHPLIFSEESYEVVSAGEFWLEALFHLSEQTGNEKWKHTYNELKEETDDQRLAERTLAQLMDFADSQKNRLLIVVENLNMLLGDQIDDDQAWKIRHTLTNEPRIMLLASATNRFEQIENASRAMFELFRIQQLKPLVDDECNRIWELITGQKLVGEQIRPIRILTGGNPRLLTIIAKFGAHRSFRILLDDLVNLIDDHTEYFKSHLDNLAPTERKVYLALAGLWDASTAREIAKAARLDVNKTSSLLNRLIGRGAVAVEGQIKKVKWYAVAERMYNIYYLMRRRGNPTNRVKATVKFMVGMYNPESTARLISNEALTLSPDDCRDHYLAFEETIKETPNQKLIERIIASTPKEFIESPYINKNIIVAHQDPSHTGKYNNIKGDEISEIDNLITQGIRHIENGEPEQGIDKFDVVLRKYSHVNVAAIQKQVARAMLRKGGALWRLNRFEEAIAVCDTVVARFDTSDEAAIQEWGARAMMNKSGALGKLNRFEEAITVCDTVVAHFDTSDEAAIQEWVARAMMNKSVNLGKLNRFEEAIAVWDAVITRFNTSDKAAIQEWGARAMVSKGGALGKLNRFEEAIAVCDAVIARNPNQGEILNEIAWIFYEQEDRSLLLKAEEWSRRSDSLMPKNTSIYHTLACILSALGKGSEALLLAGKYIRDTALVEKSIEDAIELFVALAASGQARDALGLLLNCEAQKHLEPLVVGLKLYLREDVKTAAEIREVANDVVKRIEERKSKYKAAKQTL